MLHSLRARLWLSFALLVLGVLCITSVGLLVYLARNPAPVRLLYLRLEIYTTIFTQSDRLPPAKNPDKLLTALQRVDSNFNIRFSVLASTGSLVADSRPDQGAIPLPTQAALDNPPRTPQEFRDSRGRLWIYAARRMPDGSVLVASSPRVRLTLAQILQDEGYLIPMAQAGLAALAIALLLAIWLSGWISAPLRTMAQAAHAMAVGKFTPLKVQGPSEVQEVSRAFNEMAQRVQASQQSQRDFIANVSHDLKTPLTSIQGFSQAILDGTANQPEDLKKAAQIIHSEAERMNRMVLELLEIARLDARIIDFEHAPLDLSILIDQVAAQFAPQASQKEISIRTNLPLSVKITGDKDRLAQVFTNLVDNALKFSPPGSEIQINVEVKNQYVEVQVCDRGPGIPDADLERIFDRFYQVEKSRTTSASQGSRRGVGLGLAISSEIVKAHNGVIRAYNQTAPLNAGLPSPQGSVFVVKLPLPAPPSAAQNKKRKTNE